MDNFKLSLEFWTKQMDQFLALIEPILNRPYTADTTREKIMEEINALNITSEVNQLIREIISYFPKLSANERQSISDIIVEKEVFIWGSDLFRKIESEEDFRNRILWFIIKDQGRDSRDAILEFQGIMSIGQGLKLNITPILKAYLPYASKKDRYGMGSTYQLIRIVYEISS